MLSTWKRSSWWLIDHTEAELFQVAQTLADEQVNGRVLFTPEHHPVPLLESEPKAEERLG